VRSRGAALSHASTFRDRSLFSTAVTSNLAISRCLQSQDRALTSCRQR
jgi:hypothetical protein